MGKRAIRIGRGPRGSARAFAAAFAVALIAAGPAAARTGAPAADAPLVPEPPGASAAGLPRAAALPARTMRLSNEWTRSRWAFVERPTRARLNPSTRSRTVKRLGTLTEDHTDELVLALSQRVAEDGRLWVRVRLPMRPNGRTGWVPRSALGALRTVTTALHVNRRGFRATLFRGGRRVWSARIGVGEPRWPTPGGRFYVRERLVPRERNSIYGVFAFGTSAYSSVLTDWPGGGVIGIHGTNQPGLIPGRISHGCVRVRNGSISRLRRLMPLGTPILIK